MAAGVVATLVGLVLLARAADLFVEGAAGLAARLRISAVVIGAVVIGFGTSAPELLVSGLAAAQGEREIGIGNVVGSNVANVTLVLGFAAVIAPVAVHSRLLRREVPLTTLAVVTFAGATIGGLERVEGVVLLAAFAGALAWVVRATARERAGALADDVGEYLDEDARRSTRHLVRLTGAGLAGTVAGAQLLVWGAARVGEELGWSDAFIGLTVVAIGTSLPELVTAWSASRRGDLDLVVGNVLGSNLFNSLVVGGVLAVVSPGGIDDRSLAVGGIALMVGVMVAAGFVMARHGRVTRAEAAGLLVAYAATLPFLA